MSTEDRNLWLAGATVVLTIFAVIVAIGTLRYMRGRDSEVDTRTGWVEIHKAMINVRAQRAFVMLARGSMGAYASGSPNQFEERQRDYILAIAQLRGQLDRLNDDPLVLDLAAFLDNNKLMEKWQTDEYENKFDAFAQKVALKSRP